MLNNSVKGWERTLGFDKSKPARCTKLNNAEPVRVNAKLTRNCMVSLLSFPNMTIDMRADKTNIHANEKMKIAEPEFELTQEAKAGTEPSKEDISVVRAD